MYLIYKPADEKEQRYHFDQASVTNFEAEGVERETGLTWTEFGERLQKNSVLALRALLWMLQRRIHPTLKFRDVSFKLGEVDVEPEDSELLGARDALRAIDNPTDEDVDKLRQIDEMLAAREVPEDATAPKALASSDASPTS
jgi:hypothetical protein